MFKIPGKITIKIGGNYYIDTPEIILAHGESIFQIEQRASGLLSIDFDVYDKDGKKLATVRNSRVVQSDLERYEIGSAKDHFWAKDKVTGKVLCEIKIRSKAAKGCEIEVSVDLFTKKGIHIEATPEKTVIARKAGGGALTVSGCTFQAQKAAIVID
jgi:hypothetical protein